MPAGRAPVVLGVSGLYHDSAAAVVRGGEIIAAAQEERFTRRRHDSAFPDRAIAWCIEQAGGVGRIDAAAFYEDPALTLDRILRSAVETAPESMALFALAAPLQLGQKINVAERLMGWLGPAAADNLHLVDHHLSHAASAFYPSPFPDAAILVVDGMGEWASTTIARGGRAGIETLAQIRFPHSLGLFYAAFTWHCGFRVNSGEYKLMGLAPFGEPRYVQRILDHVIDLRPDGSFRLDMRWFGYLTDNTATSPAFETLFGVRREPEARITAEYCDIAASAQAVLEEAMLRLARRALAVSGSRNLCLAGGVALNCVANARIRREVEGLEHLWIQPAAGDAGGALGAALQVSHAMFGAPRHAGVGRGIDSQRGSLLGPAYDDAAAAAALAAAGVHFHPVPDCEARDALVVQALADGMIVGRFDGPMEFGPRALGNRSILADARRADGQSHINLRVKFRETWRPFAPSVLAEHAADLFELDIESPYMLMTAAVRPELRLPGKPVPQPAGDDLMARLAQPRSAWPSVTHVDFSARVQTVDAVRNPGFHALLTRFHAVTGCPVLLNTSFNLRGEPIVASPADAVRCFLCSGLDLLVIGGFLAWKREQPPGLRALEGSARHEPD